MAVPCWHTVNFLNLYFSKISDNNNKSEKHKGISINKLIYEYI